MIDIEAVRRSRRKYLTPEEAAGVLGVKAANPRAVRLQAKIDAAAYGLPVVQTSRGPRIPRKGFLRWLKGGPAYPETR